MPLTTDDLSNPEYICDDVDDDHSAIRVAEVVNGQRPAPDGTGWLELE